MKRKIPGPAGDRPDFVAVDVSATLEEQQEGTTQSQSAVLSELPRGSSEEVSTLLYCRKAIFSPWLCVALFR